MGDGARISTLISSPVDIYYFYFRPLSTGVPSVQWQLRLSVDGLRGRGWHVPSKPQQEEKIIIWALRLAL